MNRLQKKSSVLLLFTALLLITGKLMAQDEQQKTMEIYGAIQADVGYNFNQIDPDWYDVIRTTKLPSYKNQYGTNGNVYFSVRQTRLGFKNYFQTALGELKTTFEFEMFGTGVDAGQTTFRLRHAYAELGKFGVGQYWSPFMDIDVFPNTLEYWGPVGMPLFRNVQIRYMPIQGDNKLTFALERPGASADQGKYAGRVELQGVNPRFPLPDFSAEYRKAFKWGYVELAGILRYIKWEDQNNDQYNFSGDALGWGLNLTSNIKAGKNTTFRLGVVYGEGIENYMNDAPVDIGVKNNPGNTVTPLLGKALPVLGITAFVDHNWNEKFSSSLGYSSEDITNSDAQNANEFHRGQYAIGNLLWYPAKNVMAGVELQWGHRENYNDGWKTDITKLQFSFKYNFSQTFYRK
ncbi:DcaP family trimeric outer membrane transporter [Chitinophagaceae bacterium 26-R-25]|nr:DcaP family trimeric outer membrane transporter [Chitinophagaceae bacterium 26-R-25]